MVKKCIFIMKLFVIFFAASFVVRFLKYKIWENYENFFKLFLHFLKHPKYDIVRLFLNIALADKAISREIYGSIDKLSQKFRKLLSENENFSYVINKKLSWPNLATLLEKLLEIRSIADGSDSPQTQKIKIE